MEFNYTKLIFSCELESNASDLYHFFAIRREFAEIFRRAVGCDGKGKERCSSVRECPYEQVFSQEMSSNPYAIKRFQKPPLPFAFDPPLLPFPPNRGSRLEIGLTLAGNAVNHLLCFIDSVKAMLDQSPRGMSGVAKLLRIESVDYLGNRMVIAEDGREVETDRFSVLSMDGLEKTAILPTESVSLTIATPLRILKDGLPVRELSFSALAMNLLRRMSAMAFYYCSMELDLDYRWMAKVSADIEIEDNEFRWVEWGRNLAGIIGKGTFTGNLVEFHPCLLFGENFHAGKGSAYGLGCYSLDKAP